jgi:peroxiredoxin Q/BCP
MTTNSPTTTSKAAQRHAKAQTHAEVARRQERRRRLMTWVAAGVAAAVVLGGLYAIFRAQTESDASAGAPGDYEVGSPGPGETAPDFTLASAEGQQVALSDFRGDTVLLYFHEGLGCQPCWDQIRDLEAASAELDAAGIDELVSITSAPADLLAQKMDDDGLESLALADPDLDVIADYEANNYGMMGDTRAGHSFLLVDPEGEIVWRADYGGAPDYTMYLPVDKVLADLQAGRIQG